MCQRMASLWTCEQSKGDFDRMQEPEQSYRALLVSDAASLPSGLGSGFGEKVLKKMGSQRLISRPAWGAYQNSSRYQG